MAANRAFHLQDRRWDLAVVARSDSATPAEFREDLLTMLAKLDEAAHSRNLPAYLPDNADVLRMARTVRLFGRVRRPGASRSPEDYLLPAERDDRKDKLPRPWEELAASCERLVVIADPGMGKSWLLRTHTSYLARAAFTALRASAGIHAGLAIPVLVRADALAASPGRTLAEAVTRYLVGEGLLPARSGPAMRERVAAGQVVLLIDALDEVPRAASTPGEQAPRKRLDDLLHDWANLCTGTARCILAARLTGYTGSPVPGAQEAELLPFSPEDAQVAVAAWHLPTPAEERVSKWLNDPGVAGMTRLPLLLALVCSLAAREADNGPLPETRAGLYEAVLWEFLSGAHRTTDRSAPITVASPAERQELLRLLAKVAYAFAATPHGWVDQMPYNQLIEVIAAADEAPMTQASAVAVLERLTQAGILVPTANPAVRDQGYMFAHRTIAEYLVARYLQDLPYERRMQIVAEHQWFDPDWAEVIPMLASLLLAGGRQDDVSSMITHFQTQRPGPLHRAFFFGLRIITESAGAGHTLSSREERILAKQIDRMLSRRSAYDELTHVLKSAPVLPQVITDALLAYLSLGRGYVRRSFREFFNELKCGWPNLYISLIQFHHHRPGPQMAMGLLAGRDSPEIEQALLQWVGFEEIGDVAAEELAARGSPRVEKGLLELLRSGDDLERFRAAEALDGRDSPDVREALLCALGDDDDGVRTASVRGLAWWKDSPEVVNRVLRLLGDEDYHVINEAVDLLSQSGAPNVAWRLLVKLEDKDSSVRGAAVRALRGRDSPEVVEALIARLSDKSSWVRRVAIHALTDIDSPEVVEAFKARMADEDQWVRLAAEGALASEGPSDPKEHKLLPSNGDLQTSMLVPLATWRGTFPDVVQRAMSRLYSRTWEARQNAVQELAAQEGPNAVNGLLARVTDRQWDVQWAAAEALVSRDDPMILIQACQPTLRALRTGWRTTRDRLARSTADHLYLMLPPERRPRIRRRLARITQ